MISRNCSKVIFSTKLNHFTRNANFNEIAEHLDYAQSLVKNLTIPVVNNCDTIFEEASKFPDEDIECDATEADIY